MGGFKLMNSRDYFDLLNNSTFVQNVNAGIVQPTDYFGKKANSGLALQQNSVYNNTSNFQANMTKAQSNYMTPNKVT
jgi:hypothetical protein